MSAPARLDVSSRAARRLRVKAIARRHVYVLRRSPHRFFDVVVWPLVDVLLFGSLGVFFARQGNAAEIAAAYLLAATLLWHVVYQSQISMSTGFLEEVWTRQLLSMMVTPLSEAEYVAGLALFGLAKLAMGMALVALAAWVFYAVNVFSLGVSLVPVIAILLVVGWTVALVVIGLVLRFGSGAEALAWGVMFALLPISGVFYPPEAIPAALRPLSQLLPTTHAFAAGRALLDGAGMPWREVGLAAAGAAVAAALALLFLRHMLVLFRQRGYVTRYS